MSAKRSPSVTLTLMGKYLEANIPGWEHSLFWIPQPKEGLPVPERCTHKCVQCGMYFQHPGYMKCAEAKHKDCKVK